MKPPMHALHALSQNAPARQKEGAQKRCATEGGRVPKTEGDASPRGEKNGLQCWAKRTGKTPCDEPRAPPRGVQPGWRSRWRRALGGEQGMESRRQPMCPCGWHQENPGGTQGHGPHQGAKSAYNAPRGEVQVP